MKCPWNVGWIPDRCHVGSLQPYSTNYVPGNKEQRQVFPWSFALLNPPCWMVFGAMPNVKAKLIPHIFASCFELYPLCLSLFIYVYVSYVSWFNLHSFWQWLVSPSNHPGVDMFWCCQVASRLTRSLRSSAANHHLRLATPGSVHLDLGIWGIKVAARLATIGIYWKHQEALMKTDFAVLGCSARSLMLLYQKTMPFAPPQ